MVSLFRAVELSLKPVYLNFDDKVDVILLFFIVLLSYFFLYAHTHKSKNDIYPIVKIKKKDVLATTLQPCPYLSYKSI